MRKRVRIALVVLFVAAFGVAGWNLLRSPGWLRSPAIVELPDGDFLKLERYEFQGRTDAQPMPVTLKDAGLEFTLEKFAADSSRSRTSCGFGIREDGQDSVDWWPVSLEISDATGNHWCPPWDSISTLEDGRRVIVKFFGALWPEEDAWKLRVGFKRVAHFREHELLRIDHLPIPSDQELIKSPSAYETNGARIEIAAIIGAEADDTLIRVLNAERRHGCFTVVIRGRIRSQGRHLTFVGAKDEHGNAVNLEGTAAERDQVTGQSPDFLPYSFNFKAPQDGHELTLQLAVNQGRIVEFLAKPDQTKAGERN